MHKDAKTAGAYLEVTAIQEDGSKESVFFLSPLFIK